MHAQIAATLRHLKQALAHLHDASLHVQNIDKAAAHAIEQLRTATREQIKQLELTNNSHQ